MPRDIVSDWTLLEGCLEGNLQAKREQLKPKSKLSSTRLDVAKTHLGDSEIGWLNFLQFIECGLFLSIVDSLTLLVRAPQLLKQVAPCRDGAKVETVVPHGFCQSKGRE